LDVPFFVLLAPGGLVWASISPAELQRIKVEDLVNTVIYGGFLAAAFVQQQLRSIGRRAAINVVAAGSAEIGDASGIATLDSGLGAP